MSEMEWWQTTLGLQSDWLKVRQHRWDLLEDDLHQGQDGPLFLTAREYWYGEVEEV